jgi:hypothetical protein
VPQAAITVTPGLRAMACRRGPERPGHGPARARAAFSPRRAGHDPHGTRHPLPDTRIHQPPETGRIKEPPGPLGEKWRGPGGSRRYLAG